MASIHIFTARDLTLPYHSFPLAIVRSGCSGLRKEKGGWGGEPMELSVCRGNGCLWRHYRTLSVLLAGLGLDEYWKTAAMQQSTAHLVTTRDPTADIEDAMESQAEDANADGDAIMTEASTFLIPLPFERDPEPQTMVPEKPSRGDSQQAITRAVKPTPMLPTVAKPESTSQIDTRFEATKIPLDLAIFHSIQANTTGAGSGGPDRLKKMLACILVVGGTALTPGMLGALDSR